MNTIVRGHELSSAMPSRARPALPGWIHVSVLAALVIALYHSILRDLVLAWWSDPNYSHGFLVPVWSGFLVWQRRRALAALEPRGRWIGFPVLLAGVAALVLGDVGAESFLLRSSLIVILAGLILFHLGAGIFRVVAFPLAFLLFMIPIPAVVFYAIAFPLQSFAAQNAAWALDLLGVPVLLDGNLIQLSQITLGVTEACSGIRSLISLLAMAVAWAHLTLRGPVGMAALVVSAVPITIAANGARVVATGLVAEWLGVEYATGFFHGFSGWLIFVVAIAGLAGMHALVGLVGRLRHRGDA